MRAGQSTRSRRGSRFRRLSDSTQHQSLSGGSIGSRLLRSAASNYALLVVRLVVGVLLSRILFLNLPRIDYGFWVLLWSVFGYTLLLDFGFGVAMAKYVSQATMNGDWKELNRRLNTVFFISCAMGLLVAVATIACLPLVPTLLRSLGVSATAQYQIAFLIFGIGRALITPLGGFAEVLRGLDRIPLRNAIRAISLLSDFALLAWIVHLELGLVYMAAASLSVALLSNVGIALFIRRLVPEFRLSWRLFDRRLLKETLSFSIFAYVVTISTLIILRTDLLVISVFLSLALVASYHVVWRLSEIFGQLSMQLLEALGPVAAALFVSRGHDQLRETLFNSGRAIACLGTFFFVPLFVYLKPVLKIWLDLEEADAQLCGLLLLTSTYIHVVFKSTTSQVLLMCQKERVLASATVTEAVLNLGLSIAFCVLTDLGIVGVALGTLIPVATLSLFVYIPLTCRFSSISVFAFLRGTLGGTVLPALLAAGTYYGCRIAAPPENLVGLVLNAVPGAVVFVTSFLYLGLRPDERRRAWQYFSQ